MKAEQLARLLMRVLPGQRARARHRLASLCTTAAAHAGRCRDERLEIVAAVGESALRRPDGGLRPGEFFLLAHLVGQQ
jgi:hypothetical protein